MTPSPRLVEIACALQEAGLRFLIMGGHAVRFYHIDRNTVDFDFHINVSDSVDLEARLKKTRLFGAEMLVPAAVWRKNDFFRFQIGVLPNGKEEWLEFWTNNHLLAPFDELYSRREEQQTDRGVLSFMGLADLIRSKETEREDDWRDVSLLEELLDERAFSREQDVVKTLAMLRTRRGLERGMAHGIFSNQQAVCAALAGVTHPVTRALLIPFAKAEDSSLEPAIARALKTTEPGGTRHIILLEAVRSAYRRRQTLPTRSNFAAEQTKASNTRRANRIPSCNRGGCF